MKIHASLIFILLLVVTLHRAHGETQQRHLSAKICFDRFESNGAINVHETKIELSNHQFLSLIGGQAACVFLTPGEYSFHIKACKAYETPCQKWSSQAYSFIAKTNTPVFFEIYPTSSGSAYTGYFAARPVRKGK